MPRPWLRSSSGSWGPKTRPSANLPPIPYLRAVTLLAAQETSPGLRPADCLAIEDSRWGLESARAAGLQTIAITHTYSADALAGAADLVIDTLDRLEPEYLIQMWNVRS